MSINQIEEALLNPTGLTEQNIADTLASIATRQIDYADIYFQSSWHESLVLEDSIIKDGSFNIDCGVGVRAVSGEKTGFAYSDQIQLMVLSRAQLQLVVLLNKVKTARFKRSNATLTKLTMMQLTR